MKNIWSLVLCAVALSLAGVATSCSDDDEVNTSSRLFRPVNVEVGATENTVTASWASIEGATGYTVEFYKNAKISVGEGDDKTTYTNRELILTDANVATNSWSISGLEFETTYALRVKANSADPTFNSRFTELIEVKTPQEIQVLTATIADADAGVVRFEWLSGYNLTYVVVVSPDGAEERVDINDAAGSLEKTLSSGTYTAYAGNDLRTFNTVEFVVPTLKEVAAADIRFESVTLRWVKVPGLVTLEIVSESDKNDIHTYDVSILTEPEITVTDLHPMTLYRATLIKADDSRTNSVLFTTKDKAPEGMITVSDFAELEAAIASAAAGQVIALNPGEYNGFDAEKSEYKAITLAKGVTLVAATDEKPKVIVKQFNIKGAADIELIRMEGLEFAGYDEDTTSTDTYLINLDGGHAGVVTRIEIENCYIHGISNSLVRADRAKTTGVKNVLINNNLLYNMNGKQSYVSTYADGGIPTESITFTNNTVTGLGRKNANQRPFGYLAQTSFVLTISNNTFYNCQNGTANFIHARGTADGSYGTVNVKSNIFYAEPSDHVKKPNKAPSFGEGAILLIENNCLPWAWGTVKETETVYEDWTNYGSSVLNPEFVDAAGFDFTPTNSEIIKMQCGDPRWLPAAE